MLENQLPVQPSSPPAKKKKKKKMSPMHLWRRVTQFAFLFALNPWFYANLGFCVPVMNCWACPAAAFGCPIGAIGEFLALGMIPFLSVGLIILAGALIGRMLCGWVCPFGLIQDLMHNIPIPGMKKKLKFPKVLAYAKYVFLIVTVIWIPMEFGISKGEEQVEAGDFFFCHLCPAGTLEAAIPVKLGAARREVEDEAEAAEGEELAEAEAASVPTGVGGDEMDLFGDGGEDPFGDEGAAMGMEDDPLAEDREAALAEEDDPFADLGDDSMDLFGEEEESGVGEAGGVVTAGAGDDAAAFLLKPRMFILYAFLAMFVLFRRPFCRGMCPIGAIFSVLNKISFLRLKVDKELCKDCNLCAKVCPAGNRLCDSPSNQDCVRCLECISACKLDAAQIGSLKRKKQAKYWE
ncbi:MAG: 4Fe-4S binding protein [Planctomycetota bacterium]